MKEMKLGGLSFPPAAFGILLTATALIIPVFGYLDLSTQFKSSAIFSQYLGAFTLITMAMVQLLATRLKWLENIFGGLDRIYVFHKWLAISAIVSVLLHENIDAHIHGNHGGSHGSHENSLSDLAEEVGDFAQKGILLFSIITAMTFIPYHIWKWSHKLMGLFFMMGVFHFLFIRKAFDTTDPLGLYLLFFCIIGVGSYVYILFFRDRLTRFEYRIDEMRNLNGITEVSMVPVGRKLSAKTGQFAFIRFQKGGLKEAHPFTLSDAVGDDGRIRFSIKSLGRYTSRLADALKAGEAVSVTGPFGRFSLEKGSQPQIWIAGGIGITPFLAFTKDPDFGSAGPVRLYYCVRSPNEVPYAKELQEISDKFDNFQFTVVNTHQSKRLTAQQILQENGESLSDSVAYFCGPERMRIEMWQQLRKAGIKRKNFRFENFEIRTGIGFTKLYHWLRSMFLGNPGQKAGSVGVAAD